MRELIFEGLCKARIIHEIYLMGTPYYGEHFPQEPQVSAIETFDYVNDSDIYINIQNLFEVWTYV